MVNQFDKLVIKNGDDRISEETVRTYLNELLKIFGWDVKNPKEVVLGVTLDDHSLEKMIEIQSDHKIPDYWLVQDKIVKTFIDAKSLNVNVCTDKKAAFQVRSYGWSAGAPCAIASNFKDIVIFDTREKPNPHQKVDEAAIIIHYTDFLNQYDVLYERLDKAQVLSDSLERTYSYTAQKPTITLNADFNNFLSETRLKICQDIIGQGQHFTDSQLNFIAEVLITRILFIRICEARGFEPKNCLKNLLDHQIIEKFEQLSNTQYHSHYGNTMFEIYSLIDSVHISDQVLSDFIQKLYYPSPYMFNVIPTNVIAAIYEDYLSSEIRSIDGNVQTFLKEDYVKSNGAVPTPDYLARLLCNTTVQLSTVNTPDNLFNLKILDPACGSGIFLIVTYELLCEKLQSLCNQNDQWFDQFCCNNEDVSCLKLDSRLKIMKNCIFGVDIDESAINVARFSLSLKIIDDIPNTLVYYAGSISSDLLDNVHENLVCGNTLMEDSDNLNPDELSKLLPINLQDYFETIFKTKDGFDYVIGNPPYVETKNYRAASPKLHEYLKKSYQTYRGKADLSLLFIERSLSLLGRQGTISFIIQKRWFKTEYGEPMRALISNKKLLSRIIDFEATDIFPNRLTYVSIISLQQGNKTTFECTSYRGDRKDVEYCIQNGLPPDKRILKIQDYSSSPWDFSNIELNQLRDSLSKRVGTLGTIPGIHIRTGIQVLWKKVFQFEILSEDESFITGKNKLGENYTFEKEMTRYVIDNDHLYSFKSVKPTLFCLFPYLKSNPYQTVAPSRMEIDFPLTFDYLAKHEELIKQNVKTNSNCWYKYTREQNHDGYDNSKIIIPMTSKDTIASVVQQSCFLDNANMWSIEFDCCDIRQQKAIASIVNSSIFSILGKANANPQANGYYKFNRQFLDPIPFPVGILKDTDHVMVLANYYDVIESLFKEIHLATPVKEKVLCSKLQSELVKLDDYCEKLYSLNYDEHVIIAGYKREDRQLG